MPAGLDCTYGPQPEKCDREPTFAETIHDLRMKVADLLAISDSIRGITCGPKIKDPKNPQQQPTNSRHKDDLFDVNEALTEALNELRIIHERLCNELDGRQLL